MSGSQQEKVELYEKRLEQRAKNQERLKGFYKRQMDRNDTAANELRVELNEAKKKLEVMEYGTKKAERNNDVARTDLDRQQQNVAASLAKQVGKVASLLANVRGMRAHAATTTTLRARAAARRDTRLATGNLVRYLIFLFARLFC
jgi:hypothetical protein